MVFSAISRVSSFEADDTDNFVCAGQEKNSLYASLHHIDAVRPTIKAEREKLYSKADLSKQKWNSLVSAVSTHTLGPVHSRRRDGVLAVKVSLLAYDKLLCLV